MTHEGRKSDIWIRHPASTGTFLARGKQQAKGLLYFRDADGDRIFRGTVKTNSKADGSWESTWEGTYEYRGGSGKFKNLKGSGKYKGKVSSQDLTVREEGRETVEY